MDIPITLVIKAPNQRVEDQTVECMLGWTVRKLKRHLESVYPSKPKEHHQKLIYSGKLLTDDIQLKDVLRQQEDIAPTVHLVCSSHSDTSQSESKENMVSVPLVNKTPQESVSTPSTTSHVIGGEGLRHRHQPTSVADTAPPTHPNLAGGNPLLHPQQMVMPPGAEMFYTQEQYMMMMQYYYQQQMAAAHYMQYYQTGSTPTPPNTPTTPREEHVNQNPENPPPAGDDAGGGVMNAQGGMMDDDDDEFGQRDWLDYIHTFARFMVLMSIMYFYSNFTRCILVFFFFVIIYLYQTGWFQLARRVPENQERNAQEQPQQQPPREQPADAQQPPQEQPADAQQHRDNPNQQQVNNNTNPETTTGSTVVEPPRPGVIAVAWCFVSTFFTSLIPQPPPAVNAN